jgi:hypothetical protein
MSAVFTPTRHELSVEDCHKLSEVGILHEDSRVELIDGELMDLAPIGAAHTRIVNRLTRLLVLAVGDLGVVSIRNPITLPPRAYSALRPRRWLSIRSADLDNGLQRGCSASARTPLMCSEILAGVRVGRRAYGEVYGSSTAVFGSMQKTTIYLPDELKRAVSRLAQARGISEARLVREALQTLTKAAAPPRPRWPLFRSGRSGLAERVEEALEGFGQT